MITVNKKPEGHKGIDISWPLHVYRKFGKEVYTGQSAIAQLQKEEDEKNEQ